MYELAIKHDKDVEEIQQSFNEKTAFICSICLVETSCKDKIEALPCLHEYHSDCINEWLKIIDECPVCRSSCAGAWPGAITG